MGEVRRHDRYSVQVIHGEHLGIVREPGLDAVSVTDLGQRPFMDVAYCRKLRLRMLMVGLRVPLSPDPQTDHTESYRAHPFLSIRASVGHPLALSRTMLRARPERRNPGRALTPRRRGGMLAHSGHGPPGFGPF